jgi:hypothetical protein
MIEGGSVADEHGLRGDRTPTGRRRTRTSRPSSTDRSPSEHGLHGGRTWISSPPNTGFMVVERGSLADEPRLDVHQVPIRRPEAGPSVGNKRTFVADRSGLDTQQERFRWIEERAGRRRRAPPSAMGSSRHPHQERRRSRPSSVSLASVRGYAACLDASYEGLRRSAAGPSRRSRPWPRPSSRPIVSAREHSSGRTAAWAS